MNDKINNGKLNIRNTSDGQQIFDCVRKKYVVLTPEELVRQNIIMYLANVKNYPINLMRIEASMKLNSMQKRCDILIYTRNRKPLLMVECKAENIKITQDIFNQLSRYNLIFKVPYLVATNGEHTYCCKINFETQSYEFLNEIPAFEAINDLY
ncbi:MAG: type I restriction enzyme HsdR N-terminal domain-containing protein [Prevotellaceae bacterium]|nr:type I restriction enzyme HsdR N-terminal domain-containing protein [Prevotellaceae bacterium]